jgi:zinc finger FYVE domain-containing protein 26
MHIIGGHALRHLRDRLVASELWPLALEVSTKAGLERGGVWAAWGKACLRAGRCAEAREHFVHCLQPPMSAQDPSPAPLLSEIIRILEETSYFPDSAVMKQAEHISAPAFSVLHSLAALKDISQGKFQSGPAVNSQPLFYSESQYYLRTYGSHAATLAFFLSHSDLSSALNYAKERRIEPDVFAEALYKPCLRQGLIGKLHDELRNSDTSLEVWKVSTPPPPLLMKLI